MNLAPAKDVCQPNCRPRSAYPEEDCVFESSEESSMEDGISVSPSGNGGSSSSEDGETPNDKDHSDAILRFISIMLMEEEDLENKPCILRDCLALQATEKSLYDVLANDNLDQDADHFNQIGGVTSLEISSFLEPSWSDNLRDYESLISPSQVELQDLQSHLPPLDGIMVPASRFSREKPAQGRRNRFCRRIQEQQTVGQQHGRVQVIGDV